MVFWPFCGCAETGTGETANDFEGWSVCRILHGSAHSIPRAAHAERFELFAAFVQLLAGQVNADGRAGLTRLCQSSMPYSPSRARQLGSPHVRGLLGTLRERRAVELDTSLPALGRLAAALGVQMPWIPFSAPGRTGFGREGEAAEGWAQDTAVPAVAGRRRRAGTALGRRLRVWVGTAVWGPAAFSQPPPGGGRSRRKGPARGAPDGSRELIALTVGPREPGRSSAALWPCTRTVGGPTGPAAVVTFPGRWQPLRQPAVSVRVVPISPSAIEAPMSASGATAGIRRAPLSDDLDLDLADSGAVRRGGVGRRR